MLSRIHHIGVAVRSADEALRFYRDVLGLPVTKDAVLEEQGIRGVLLSAGHTEIELLEPLRPETPVGRFLAQRGEGLHHLCFQTDDVAQELAVARGRGLTLVDERPRPGLAGTIAFLHPKATRGVLVEYAQPPTGEPAGMAHHSKAARVRFDHVAVAVADLEAGASVFRANFDLVETERRTLPALGIRAVTLPIGDAWIGVVTPLARDSSVQRFLDERGEGLYLISLAVADLDRAAVGLAGAGARVTGPVAAGIGARVAFISPRSAFGALIQLVEERGVA